MKNDLDELFEVNPSAKGVSWFLKWFFTLVLISVIVASVGWVLKWLFLPAQVVSVENVREQWRFAYQYDESLKAIAQQICSTSKAVTNAESSEEKSQRRSQLIALEQNYARVEAEYNSKLRNAFEAKLVRPSDVPERAPTMKENVSQSCN